MILSYNLM